jgi:carbonic anhydrase/acetyltransferase-like protein (isoleucine patch superfamily)
MSLVSSADADAPMLSSSNDLDDSSSFICTASKAYVSRQATIHNPSQLELPGGRCVIDRNCLLQTDRASVSIGRYSYIEHDCTILPPPFVGSDNPKYIRVSIGDYVHMSAHCHCQAAKIGNDCYIGHHVRLGQRVIVHDGCYLADYTTLPDDCVVPPFTRVQPPPTPELQWSWPHYMELPNAVVVELQEQAMERYHDFAARQQR